MFKVLMQLLKALSQFIEGMPQRVKVWVYILKILPQNIEGTRIFSEALFFKHLILSTIES